MGDVQAERLTFRGKALLKVGIHGGGAARTGRHGCCGNISTGTKTQEPFRERILKLLMRVMRVLYFAGRTLLLSYGYVRRRGCVSLVGVAMGGGRGRHVLLMGLHTRTLL